MKNITIKENISKQLLSVIEKAQEQGFKETTFHIGAIEGEETINGKKNTGVFVDEIMLKPLAVTLLKIVRSGKIGNVQSMDVALNFTKEQVKEKIWSHLYLGSLLCGGKILKRCVEESEKGYYHGYAAYELENGALIRLLYTSAPEMEKEYAHIYGNEGEIRVDFLNDTAKSYKQSPDYAGDEIVKVQNVEEILMKEFSSMCVNATIFTDVESI